MVKRRTQLGYPSRNVLLPSDHIVVCIAADFLRKMAQANDCRAFDDHCTDSMMDIGSRYTAAAGCRNFAYRRRTARHILVEELRIRYVHMVYIAFQRQEQSLCTSRGA